MKKTNRVAAALGAAVLALPLSACAEDEPDVVIDEEETSEVVPEDEGDDTGGDTGGETDEGEGLGGETDDGGDTTTE